MIGSLFLISIVVLSQAATLIRFADAHALAIVFWRLVFATLLLAPLGLRRGGWKQAATLSRSERWQLFASGVLIFVHFFFFFRSVQETSIANSTILFSLNPVFTAIGAWVLFRERVSKHLVVALTVGILGVAVLFGETWAQAEAAGSWQGNLYGILSAACFSGYILTGKRVRASMANTTYATWIYAQAALYGGFACLALDIPLGGYTPTTWWAFLALAVLPTLLGHALFTYCLNYLNITFMSCMTLVEPLLAALVAYWLFSEPFTAWAGAAFVLTCVSVLALYWPSVRTRLWSDSAGEAA
ncbi:MAG: DMT family transporter [Bdellovibrionaceae bacterium]|nr:DMT family transporter [Pseudobdellovibrionaceae bacterium]